MVALSSLARCAAQESLPALRETTAAFTHLCALLRHTSPLEAAALHYLHSLASHHKGLPQEAQTAELIFLQTRIIVLLEDRAPAAALHLLLECALHAARQGLPDTACDMLDAAFAVYQQYCALPPTALGGLSTIVHCLSRVRGLPRERFDVFAELVCRYATSMPARQDKVCHQRLCEGSGSHSAVLRAGCCRVHAGTTATVCLTELAPCRCACYATRRIYTGKTASTRRAATRCATRARPAVSSTVQLPCAA